MARVAVTTTPDRYRRHAARLEGLGLIPVMLSCIELIVGAEEILATAREEASRADWIVVTSVRAVEVLWPHGGMPLTPVAAVGPHTAAAVGEAGGRAEMVGDGGASRMTNELGALVPGRSVFFPHASGADPRTASALRDAGAEVTTEEVYKVIPIPPGSEPVDAVMFASPSAVSGWFLSRDLRGLVVGAVGLTTAAAIARRGVRPDVVPQEPSFDRLARLMAENLTERSAV